MAVSLFYESNESVNHDQRLNVFTSGFYQSDGIYSIFTDITSARSIIGYNAGSVASAACIISNNAASRSNYLL